MNECPICGRPGIDLTVHGDTAQKFTCAGGHRWELRPDVDGALNLHQQPEPQTGFKGLLQRIFG